MSGVNWLFTSFATAWMESDDSIRLIRDTGCVSHRLLRWFNRRTVLYAKIAQERPWEMLCATILPWRRQISVPVLAAIAPQPTAVNGFAVNAANSIYGMPSAFRAVGYFFASCMRANSSGESFLPPAGGAGLSTFSLAAGAGAVTSASFA